MNLRSIFSSVLPYKSPKDSDEPHNCNISNDHFLGLEDKFNDIEAQTEDMRRVVTHVAGLSSLITQGLANLKLVAKFMDKEELNQCALIHTSIDGRIVKSQYNVERIFGISGDQLIGNNIIKFVAPRFQKYYKSQLSKITRSATGELFDQVTEVVYTRFDGREIYCEERTKIIDTPEGLIFQKLLKDITDLRTPALPYGSSLDNSPDHLEVTLKLNSKFIAISAESNLDSFDAEVVVGQRVDQCPLFSMNSKFWNKVRAILSVYGAISKLVVKVRFKSEIIYVRCDITSTNYDNELIYHCKCKTVPYSLRTTSNIRHDILYAISEISNDVLNSSGFVSLDGICKSLMRATRAVNVTASKYVKNQVVDIPSYIVTELGTIDDSSEFEPHEIEILKAGKILVRTVYEFSEPRSSTLQNENITLVGFIPILINSEVWGTINLYFSSYPMISVLKYLETLGSVIGSFLIREQRGSELKVLNMAFESLFISSPLPMIFHINGTIISINNKARELLQTSDLKGQDITVILPKYTHTAYIEELALDKSTLVVTSDFDYEGEQYSQVVLTDLTEIHNRDKYITALTAATSKVDDLIIITNNKLSVIYANPASNRIFNTEIINQPLTVVDELNTHIRSMIKSLDKNHTASKVFIYKDIHIDINIIEMLNLENDPIFYIIIGKVQV